MKFILILIFSSLTFFLFGQISIIEWQNSIGGSNTDYATSIQQTVDDGFIVGGYSKSIDGDLTFNNGNFDYWVSKLDMAGNIIWQKSLGGSEVDYARAIQQTSDGGYIVAGQSYSNNNDVIGNHGVSDAWVVKLDANGNISWQKCLGGTGDDEAYSIQQTIDGGYIIAGSTTSNDGDVSFNNGSSDYWIIKLDATGNITWEKSLGGSNADNALSIDQTSDGGYIVAGWSFSNNGDVTGNHGGVDYWIVKLNSTGSITWQKSLGGLKEDRAFAIQQSSDGGYIVGGWSFSSNGDVTGHHGTDQTTDYWIVKLNALGNVSWQKSLGGTDYDGARSIQETSSGGYIIVGDSFSNDDDVTSNLGGSDAWIVKLDSFGNINWQKPLGGPNDDALYSVKETTNGEYICAGRSSTIIGDNDYWIVKVNEANIQGKVYNDINENCNNEILEPGVGGIDLIINPGNIIVTTNSYGGWYLDSLPVGTYSVTIDTTNLNWTPTCNFIENFTVVDMYQLTFGPSFGLVNNNPCSSPDVSIYAPFLRRCFTDQKIYIRACNEIIGTSILSSTYVEVELDQYLSPTSSSLPYTSLGNNIYRFELGDLYPDQCIDFTINTTISCDAILGETLCMDARIYPIENCALDSTPTDTIPSNYGNDTNLVMPQACSLPWDNSSLQVEGFCQGDSVQFSITNTGDFGGGDMDCYSPVFFYVNDTLVSIDSIQLLGQETVVYSYPANGQTWILAAEQHPLHPGNSHPNAHVELCGTDSTLWVSDLVNNYPHDDADPVADIFCGIVEGSYDPNDKRGYPIGISDQHLIQANLQLQYVIRFQNTGTDTAFTVVIRDTLDTNLNIFTISPGVSSHDYTFRKYGPRVLEWTFENILLPDSTTNEPGSNGFITFTVDQAPNLIEGTLITNNADIYFDYNTPIITNETEHVISYFVESSPLLNCSLGPKINPIITSTECAPYTLPAILGSGLSGSEIYYTLTGGPNVLNQTQISDPLTSSAIIYAYDEKFGCTDEQEFEITTINPSFFTDVQEACNAFTWIDGVTYDVSNNTATWTLTNSVGCDSIITLNLTIKSTFYTDTQSACDSLVWIDGNTYYTSNNMATHTLTNMAGCDSIITLDLIINPLNIDITTDNLTMTSNAINSEYQWIDCTNNNDILDGAILQSYTATSNGDYAVIVTNNGCSDTSSCVTISTVELIDKGDLIDLEIFPNPTYDGSFTIEFEGTLQNVEIQDLLGRKVSISVNLDNKTVDGSKLAPGKYFVHMTTANGVNIVKELIISE